MQKIEKFDTLDNNILNILSKNARMPFKDVAAECGVSRAAIHQRVQRLIEIGVILGSSFNINPKSLGYTTCTYVGITLERGNMYRDVAQQIAMIPEVVECHYTTGGFDMFIKIYALNNHHLLEIIHDKLQPLGLSRSETIISFNASINRQLSMQDLKSFNDDEEETDEEAAAEK